MNMHYVKKERVTIYLCFRDTSRRGNTRCSEFLFSSS